MDTYSHVLPSMQVEAARGFDDLMRQAEIQSEIEHIAERRYEKS
jgi:hypothetical protein